MMASQPQLKLDDTGLIPLVHVGTAIYLLRRFQLNEDSIKDLFERGDLIAWNIGDVKAERRELRLWAPAVDEYNTKFGQKPRRFLWTDIVRSLLPASNKTWVDGLHLRFALNCGSTHVMNLIDAGALTLVPGSSYRRGSGGSPQILTSSFERFLTERLVAANNIRFPERLAGSQVML